MNSTVLRVTSTFYAIFDHPSDFPSHWVLRTYELQGDGSGIPTDEYQLADTLEGVRALVPAGRRNIGRSEQDAADIFEIWF